MVPVLSCCEAKISNSDFNSILAEIVKIDGQLLNLNEIINKTFLEKENIEILFRLFLDNCREYDTKLKKEPSLIEKANKILILILHLEHSAHKEENYLVQLVMNHFEDLLEILPSKNSPSKMVNMGGDERKRLGLPRVEILRLIHHCLIINHKNFNLMVSMSKFGDVLKGLIFDFSCNDRFVGMAFDVVELVLETNHKALIRNVLGNGGVVTLLGSLVDGKNKNHFVLLKILKLVDIKFDEKCRVSLEKSVQGDSPQETSEKEEKTQFLKELQENESFEILQIKIYSQLKDKIKIYFDLEDNLNDRNNTRMSGSSIFSNNLMDDVDLNENNIENSLDSEETQELENIMQDDSNENDEERNSYGGIVRRRKVSEDNINVGSGRGRGGFSSDFM